MRMRTYTSYTALSLGAVSLPFALSQFGVGALALSSFALFFAVLAALGSSSDLRKSKVLRARKVFAIALAVAIFDFVVPYLFLRDIGEFYASWLFWVLLTLIVLGVGNWKVSQWGE